MGIKEWLSRDGANAGSAPVRNSFHVLQEDLADVTSQVLIQAASNWKNEPWSRGAYSYSLIGFRKTISVCKEPVENRIYFAGEAFYEGPYPGTVEAAVVSGLETARLLKLNV